MSIRIVDELQCEPIMDLIAWETTQQILSLNLTHELLKIQNWINLGKIWFDFEKSEIINVEKVIRSAYANTERKKYPLQWEADNEILVEENDSEKWFLEKIDSLLPIAKWEIDACRINVYNTGNIETEFDKGEWLEWIKRSKWYGPYQNREIHEWYYFYSGTEDGIFNGIELEINFKDRLIGVVYLKHDGTDIATEHVAYNGTNLF